jgi:hypothetical protein
MCEEQESHIAYNSYALNGNLPVTFKASGKEKRQAAGPAVNSRNLLVEQRGGEPLTPALRKPATGSVLLHEAVIAAYRYGYL